MCPRRYLATLFHEMVKTHTYKFRIHIAPSVTLLKCVSCIQIKVKIQGGDEGYLLSRPYLRYNLVVFRIVPGLQFANPIK
jgi:hypothetical protein